MIYLVYVHLLLLDILVDKLHVCDFLIVKNGFI